MLTETVPSTRDRIAGIVVSIMERRLGERPSHLGDDLRQAGLSSLDMVNLMLAVEAEFDLKIPEAEMTPQNFRSLAAIEALVVALRGGPVDAGHSPNITASV
jgi:acyl carrier protein